ncbi:hypothetical protein R6Q57_009346 [Mikania cordata]
MDPHSFIARAEAQRWIGIAEKLLLSNDFVGSKTFAIRARESDPRLEAADQILAIADTLLAAEKRVVGNNGVQQPDFYEILQLVRFVQDTDHIADQYRRLAVVLNPHQNRFPYSEQAFQVVNDAWAVLSNPMRKSLYDADLDLQQHQQMNSLGFNLEQQQQQQQHHHQQQHQHNFFSINRLGTSREQELPDQFQSRVQQQQLHQHNFLSQNPVRSVPVREHEQLFQHQNRDQEQLFQQVQPFQITSAPQQQTRSQAHPPLQPLPAAPPQAPFSWPQTPPLSQLLQEQQPRVQPTTGPQPQAHQQFQQHQHETQQQESQQKEPVAETETADENVDESPSFWTTCPYCLYMFEYPSVYAECVLRCDTCKRAFQAVRVSSPPPIAEGQDSYFYCWGFFPLAVSMSHMQNNNGSISFQTDSNWAPFSPMYDVSSYVQDHLNYMAAPKKANKNSGPRIYIDDETDDIFEGISDPSDDSSSDHDWNSTKKKKARIMKKDHARVVSNGNSKNLSSLPVMETRKKASGVTTRRQSVRAAKELGRLDLNVEFNNNEGEEATARTGPGNRGNTQGDGDNIEGIGFFEGLDEFFSSLPILSVVNDDKVKAA